jgi:hypothetical protein
VVNAGPWPDEKPLSPQDESTEPTSSVIATAVAERNGFNIMLPPKVHDQMQLSHRHDFKKLEVN